ncbi:TPA: hypothetical protein ACKPX2_000634 [Stenotrophomonas maltophilia]|uniref:hypothetical protein n=1 Tax=Stenotrophomonas maltophilia TaxID=40324 RepID=UPI0013DA550B|nr:hypothetical protein [Stenotrophomonas maltophilia]MBH1732831.1 hypothetical protein [Stenotrophomonas maltophilia]HEL3245879.1 hypothetical protein [Stenotrophomonas maltophilia]HEL4264327.1 hypothetical protein [Stenotrophomonas maltophilia]
MSAPVDVLAVMLELEDELQSAANYSGEGCYWSRDDDDLLRRSGEARDAVAELMDEAHRCCAGTGDLSDLRAALARVKGGAA